MNAYFAEFFGTALLILLGNGVVANVCLNKTKGQSSGWIVITTAWAFAVYVAVVVTGPYSGAHLNPAVTLGVAMKGAFAWELVPGYIAAQVVGGMVGALLVYIIYKDHFTATEEEGLKRACFCTEPAIRNYPINLVNEIVGTFVLVFVIFFLAGANITLPGSAESTPIGLGSIGALPVAHDDFGVAGFVPRHVLRYVQRRRTGIRCVNARFVATKHRQRLALRPCQRFGHQYVV